MWTLLLSRVTDPPGVYFDRRQLDSGQIKVGRSEKTCDLVLPDDKGFVSREHCTISVSGLDLFVVDTSKNGVALNQPGARILPSQAVPIRPGDRLVINDFLITVMAAHDAAGIGLAPPPVAPFPEPARDTMGDDLYFGALGDPFMGDGAAHQEVHDFLRGGFNPLPPADLGPPIPSHPSDFGFADPLGEAFSRPIMAAPLAHPADFAIPEDWASPGPAAAPIPPFADLPGGPDFAPPPFAAPPPPVQTAAPQPSAAPAASTDGWAAFLEGAGLTAEELPQQPDAMYRLGVLYRQVVLGLCDVLQDRAAFKDEFRVERTQLSIGRNNPLKHLPALDAAKMLLGQQLPGFMPTEEAVRTSFEDVKKHQLAMLAGVQQALTVTFDRLSPKEIERFIEKTQGQKKGLLNWRSVDKWSVYLTIFEALRKDATSNANGVMSVAFREGYEKFMKSVG